MTPGAMATFLDATTTVGPPWSSAPSAEYLLVLLRLADIGFFGFFRFGFLFE